jgi:hypothetical protein
MNAGRDGGEMMATLLLAQWAGGLWDEPEWRAVPCARWDRPLPRVGIGAQAGTDPMLAAVVRATESGRPIRGPPVICSMEGTELNGTLDLPGGGPSRSVRSGGRASAFLMARPGLGRVIPTTEPLEQGPSGFAAAIRMTLVMPGEDRVLAPPLRLPYPLRPNSHHQRAFPRSGVTFFASNAFGSPGAGSAVESRASRIRSSRSASRD